MKEKGLWRVPLNSTLPPPPPGVRYVRLKKFGIIVSDDNLRQKVHRFFQTPMIVLALIALPVLALDYYLVKESSHHHTEGWVWWLTFGTLTLIWLAFLAEFVVKITIAENRIEYVRVNWVDMVIIIIPILRPLRVAMFFRSAQVFTLRGIGFKFLRYIFSTIVGLEAMDRILRRFGLKTIGKDPEKMTRTELITELIELRKTNQKWREWYVAEQEFVIDQKLKPCEAPPPEPQVEPKVLLKTLAS